jgi:hypothetical protein
MAELAGVQPDSDEPEYNARYVIERHRNPL